MCGICGIIDYSNVLSPSERHSRVAAMNQALLHRGPDQAGSFSDKNGSMAMRRLSIIDCAGGKQPIFNETKDICIFFNGEIYNFLTLKANLLQKGHQFYTSSDTEVLVHLYEEYGIEMLPLLRGMFSFCIYDSTKNIYFLARDRFGEKPLYYHWDNQLFSFSSEIKSLLENPYIPRQLNAAALPYYFRTSLIPEPITLLKQVKSLLPGHYLLIDKKQLVKKAYFQPTYKVNPSIQTEQEAIDYIRPKLIKAVKSQMVSDVPIGAFLSGGIDSSTVVALLQQQSSQKIKTFTIRFEDQAYNESAIAKKVADFYNTDHHEIFIPNLDFEETIFWKIIDHVGFPFRDSSAIPSFFVTQEIAKHVKVALSGDGGDELFGGYDLFQWYQKIRRLKNVPRPFRTAINGSLTLAQKLPILNQVTLFRQLKRVLNTSLAPIPDIPIALNEFFNKEQISRFYKVHNSTAVPPNELDYALLKMYPKEVDDWSALRTIMYYRLRHTLPANMLVKVDRMSMANSLEVRAPFLDADLFDASLELPDHLLVQQGKGKHILRKIMEKELPTEVFNHPKMGFSIPLFRYKNKVFQELAQRLLFDKNPWPDLIPKEQLMTIYKNGIHAQKDTATISAFQATHQLWMMMQLFGWATRFKVNL